MVHRHYTSLVWLILVFAGAAAAYSGIQSPIRSLTVPQGAAGDGLIQVPEADWSIKSNLVMTGNVVAGKHFRGQVPYGPAGDIWVRLGSRPLEWFIRATETGPYETLLSPYLLRSAAVARIDTWTSVPIRPGAIWLEQGPTDKESDIPPIPSLSTASGLGIGDRRSGWGLDPNTRSYGWPSLAVEDPCKVLLEPDQIPVVWTEANPDTAMDKYQQYTDMARTLLKEGRTQQAVDAYTMALVYNPQDLLALAGKAHALFADGQFFASALFLTRLLDLCPDYLRLDVDLGGLIGEGLLCSRIDRLMLLVDQTSEAQLRLLLAYILFRQARFEQAGKILGSLQADQLQGPGIRAMHSAILRALADTPKP